MNFTTVAPLLSLLNAANVTWNESGAHIEGGWREEGKAKQSSGKEAGI